MTGWGWTPERNEGIWRCGPSWMKPFLAAVPWLTLVVLLLILMAMSRALSLSKGVVFDLPAGAQTESEPASLVALVLAESDGTLVFFDEARYMLDERVSAAAFGDHLADRAGRVARKSLLVLADRRVPGGALMTLAKIARDSGVERILFAEKSRRTEDGE